MLKTFQPGIRKNLRTSQPQKKFTGPYKKKRVYIGCDIILSIIARARFNRSTNVFLMTLEQRRGSQLTQVSDLSTTSSRRQLYISFYLWACGNINNQDDDRALTHSADW